MKGVINISAHNCSECYRCIRACHFKAIQVVDNQTSIRANECTTCGECLDVCPHDIIQLREDTEFVKRLIKHSDKVVVSLHWSWNSEFAGVEACRIVEVLRLLGFSHVSETLLGSEYYEECVVDKLHNSPRSYIGAECPVVVRMVQRRYTQLTDRLVPVANPAVLHARMLRGWYGADCKVVHITPCLAMKPQDDEYSEIDAVLTFRELRRWMWEEGVELDFIKGNENYKFEPYVATHKRGSTIENLFRRITLSGFKRTVKSLERATELPSPMLTELWSCSGGCLESVGATDEVPLIVKELEQRPVSVPDHAGYNVKRVANYADYQIANAKEYSEIAESQIELALREIGKYRPADYHNCNACGYESCRDFARAMIQGKSESVMCMSYSRNLAQKKFTALLGKMPSGVMLVDSNLRIIEANSKVAEILGSEAQLIFGANTGMKGADLEKLINFTPILSSCLAWNKDKSDEQVQIGEHFYRMSVFSIEPHRVICVVLNEPVTGGFVSQDMTQMVRSVIDENLEAVQKIAYLLGETASRTEAVLNSIVKNG